MKCFTTSQLRDLLEVVYIKGYSDGWDDKDYRDGYDDGRPSRDKFIEMLVNQSSGGHDDRGIDVTTGEGAINRYKK